MRTPLPGSRRDPAGSAASPTGRLARQLERLDRLVDWERRSRTAALRQELAPVRDLLERLGSPHDGLPAVHVTGTKGKGSVTALVDAGLRRAGLSTGRYTSPHVERMTERVALDGVDVSDDTLAAALERSLGAREAALESGSPARDATWFDVVTGAALLVFREAGVDWAVVEVGLGGRLDSTNVVDSRACVITNVELEHEEVLGGTRAEIAAEKAGILEPGTCLVTGVPPAPDEAGAVIERRCAELGVPLLRPVGFARSSGATIAELNTFLAREVLEALGRRGEHGADGEALGGDLLDGPTAAGAALPGRLERLESAGVPVVLDGAHVPASLAAVLRDLRGDPGLPGRPVVLLAMRRDKDLEGSLKALAGAVDRVLCTAPGTGLHVAPAEMADRARRVGLVAETATSPGRALQRAVELARDGGWVLATGSLYLAGELRPLLIQGPREAGC